ncbi:MAG: hypothetical protein H7X80_04880 [bacterium]|nr:hypothetical protein [Candidatus Kapabacteria bacterium]
MVVRARYGARPTACFACSPVVLLALLVFNFSTLIAQDLSRVDELPPFALSGSIGASLTSFTTSDSIARRDPLAWTISGALTPSVYGVQLPLSFIVSSQDQSFSQPFNQFGISPSYGVLTTHFGYRSMRFSRYTLDGATFLGAGAEATPGPLRLGVMYGRLQRAVEDDSTQQFVLPAYERSGYAVKIGFGRDGDFFDLSFLRATDDTNSLSRAPTRANVTPQDNSVLGLASRFEIIPELSIEADGGASVITRDLRAGPLDAESDIPPYLLGLVTARESTALLLAMRAAMTLALTDFSLRLGYERIEPDFTSLGAYYFATDVENWTIAPSLALLEGTLNISGSIGLQHDNLMNLKLTRTDRLIGSAAVQWRLNDTFGVDLDYTNYASSQSAGLGPINDSIRVRDVSSSASFAPRVMLPIGELTHSMILVANMQSYRDQNAFTSEFSDNDAMSLTLLYNIASRQDPLSGGASFMYTDSKSAASVVNTTGLSLNGSATIADRLSLGISGGYSSTSVEGFPDSSTMLSESINAAYRLSDDDGLTLSLYAGQGSSGGGIPARNELTATLGYQRSFAWRP